MGRSRSLDDYIDMADDARKADREESVLEYRTDARIILKRLRELKVQMEYFDAQQAKVVAEAYGLLGVEEEPNDYVFDFFHNSTPDSAEDLLALLRRPPEFEGDGVECVNPVSIDSDAASVSLARLDADVLDGAGLTSHDPGGSRTRDLRIKRSSVQGGECDSHREGSDELDGQNGRTKPDLVGSAGPVVSKARQQAQEREIL